MSSSILTIPNILTLLRMALIPVFASLLYYDYYGWAFFMFFLAGISDGFDGFIARRFNQQSELGRILDPIADKLLMTTAFVILSLPHVLPVDNKHFPVPFWVTAAVIGRDILIVTVALVIILATDFRGFKPSWLGKASTVVQISAVGIILFSSIVPAFSGYYLPTIYVTVTLFAFLSGVHYIFFVAKLMRNNEKENGVIEQQDNQPK